MPRKRPSTPGRRGRPQQGRPATEAALRGAVRAECFAIVRAMLVADGFDLTRDGAPIDDVSAAYLIECILSERFETQRARDERRALAIEAAYTKLREGLEGFARIRAYLGSEPFGETNLHVAQRGLSPEDAVYERCYSARWDHLLRLAPLLDQLAKELPTMAHFDWQSEGAQSFDGRVWLLEYERDPHREDRLTTLTVARRPMTLRELAAVSLILGNWPELHPGQDTVNDVLGNEERALEKACKRLEIQPLSRGRR